MLEYNSRPTPRKPTNVADDRNLSLEFPTGRQREVAGEGVGKYDDLSS